MCYEAAKVSPSDSELEPLPIKDVLKQPETTSCFIFVSADRMYPRNKIKSETPGSLFVLRVAL